MIEHVFAGSKLLPVYVIYMKKSKLSGEKVTDLHILHLMRLRGPPGVSGYLANISVSTKLPSPSVRRIAVDQDHR